MEHKARAFVEGLLARGHRTFTRIEAEASLGSSSVATYHSLRRLQKHSWLAMPRRGFYIIVDPEHRKLGALPPTMWIDALMRFQEAPYYVGLLSAAALHGAAHQQPQEFQVVTPTILRPLIVGRIRIRSFFRRHINLALTMRVKTSSGYIPVSTPEMTALDLIRYRRGAGSIDHIATVLAELGERMDAGRLLVAAKATGELPVVQRLGYLLDRIGQPHLVSELVTYIQDRKPRMTLLETESPEMILERNSKWHVLVNTTIEVEV